MAISEELELDITGALDAIESLNQPLTELGSNLTDTLTTAIEAVDVTPLVDQLAALDASGLTTTIDAAVLEADGIVPIEADTSAVPGEIDSSIAEADTTVTIDADTAEVGGSIDEALAAADATVTIDADASGIGEEIAAEIDSADTTVVIEADGSALDELGASAEGATSGLDDASSSLSGLAGAGGAVLGGDILGGVSAGLGKAGPLGAAAAAGLGVFTAGLTTFVTAGIDAEAAQQRFNSTLGKFADDARTINVGSLNTSLEDLAIRLGSDDEKALQATATLFQFAKAAGLSGKESAGFANNVQALAARAVALNPALGDTGDVAVALQNALARGQRATAKFNIALGTTEIVQRALKNTGKTLSSDLSAQEKSFAGAQIAAKRYGAGLEKDINKGSKNAALQQRSFNEQIQDFIEEAGKPLVAPFFDLLKQLVPVAEALIPTFGVFAEAVLPVLVQILKDNVPLIKLFGELLKALSPIIAPLVRASVLLLNPLSALLAAFRGVGDLPDVAGFFSGVNDAIGDLLVNIVDLGSDLIDSFLRGIQEAFPAVITFFTDLGTTIFNTIGDVLFTIVQKGTDLITGLFTGITTAAVAVFTFFTNLAGTISNTIGDVVGTLVQKGSDFIGGLLNGLGEAFEGVLTFARELPGRIVTAIGDVGGLFADVGRAIVNGIKTGLTELLPNLLGFIKDKVVGAIKKIPFVGKLIGSPSPFFRDVGKAMDQGLVEGITSSLGSVEKASQSLVSAATSGVGALPAVAAALPVSAGSAAASTAGFTSSAQASLQGAGSGVNIQQLIVQTAAKDQTQVGIEVARQLRAESFRAGR